MAYRPMDDDKVRAFLAGLPARPAILATTRADGRPHVAPVWYAVADDGTIVFNTGRDHGEGPQPCVATAWAAMSVDDDAAPFSFVTLEGPVAISEDLDDVRHWAGVIAGRYMGADRADEYGNATACPASSWSASPPRRSSSAFAVAD